MKRLGEDLEPTLAKPVFATGKNGKKVRPSRAEAELLMSTGKPPVSKTPTGRNYNKGKSWKKGKLSLLKENRKRRFSQPKTPNDATMSAPRRKTKRSYVKQQPLNNRTIKKVKDDLTQLLASHSKLSEKGDRDVGFRCAVLLYMLNYMSNHGWSVTNAAKECTKIFGLSSRTFIR